MAFLIAASPALAESVVIKANDVHELCFNMKAGEELSYDFKASTKLDDFNIHYHDAADKTHYIEQKTDVASGNGVFTIPADENYCLMWLNDSWHTATIEYNYTSAKGTLIPAGMPESGK